MIKTTNKYNLVFQLSCKYSVSLLCEIAEVSRSGYYKYLKRSAKPDTDKFLKECILKIYNENKKVYGYRRIKVALKREFQIIINLKKVRRLMKEMKIQSVIRRKRFKYINPKILELQESEPNILNRNFSAKKLNEKWVTDITYLYYGPNRNRMYLSAIKDLFNNEIISYKLSASLDVKFVEETLNDALVKVNSSDLQNLIIHSDQGIHYKSRTYKKILQDNSITQSMSRKANCYDNACIENFFGHLKCELIHRQRFNTKESLIKSVDDYIHWYNNERFQSKLNNLTPIEFRCEM